MNLNKEVNEVIGPLLCNSNINDWLYNYLIYEKKENSLLFEDVYGDLKNIIESNSNSKILEIKNYLESKWYKLHSDCGWYDSHKGKQNTYYGYWSFEVGAVVKLLSLDDSVLKNTKYYPYDLVHFGD